MGAPIFPTLKSELWTYGQIRELLTPLSGSALSVEREVGSNGPEIARIGLKRRLQRVFGGDESLFGIHQLSGISIPAFVPPRILIIGSYPNTGG